MTETHTAKEICARYGITRAGLQKWLADPTFPAAKPPPPGADKRTRRVWNADEVRAWRTRQLKRRWKKRERALNAYKRHAGEHGHLTAVAHAYSLDVGTLRGWIKSAGLPLPSEKAA